MKTVNKSVLLWYSPREMYTLVTDVARYPEFLPWCDHTRVLEQRDDGMTAEIGIAFSGLRHAFVTSNQHHAPDSVHMRLVKGPFSKLDGHWRFLPVGDGTQRACKVELYLNYGFESSTLGRLVGPVFDKIASTLMEAFVQRATQVYGE